jgi:uncharacterized protein with ATP-grasp and redox domains
MKITFNCVPCIVNNYLRLVKNGLIPGAQQEMILRQLLEFLSKVDYDQSPPVLGKKLQHLLCEFTRNPDPYKKLKQKYNEMISTLYPDLKRAVEASADPFDMAMRLAIIGNVIDFGSQYQLDVFETIESALDAKLALDDSHHLKKALYAAKTVLYIGDNAGEIVLDRLFLETINHPNVYFVVRGGTAINDATLEDAMSVGMDKYAKVITTGDDAPGIVWETASAAFKRVFAQANVVISKGQGNFEGLSNIEHNIYFLLVVKCDLIAEQIGVKEQSLVAMRSALSPDRVSYPHAVNHHSPNK